MLEKEDPVLLLLVLICRRRLLAMEGRVVEEDGTWPIPGTNMVVSKDDDVVLRAVRSSKGSNCSGQMENISCSEQPMERDEES